MLGDGKNPHIGRLGQVPSQYLQFQFRGCQQNRASPGQSFAALFEWLLRKLCPMAITSPTLFMDEPICLDTPINLFKSQRGILQTI